MYSKWNYMKLTDQQRNIKKVNAKFTLEQATKAQRGSRVIALIFL